MTHQFFPSRNNILSIMPINALKNHTCPERVRCCPPWFGFQNNKKTTVILILFEPVCQKSLIFLMDFNNFHLSQISSILHRSARCMKHMLSRTCRFWVVKNAIYFQRFLSISLFVLMRSSKLLLPPMVLDTFSFWPKFVTIGALRCHQQISRVANFITYFQ